MRSSACFFVTVLVFGSVASAWPQANTQAKKLPDGVYTVQRESVKEKDLLPLAGGKVLIVHRHRYLKKDAKEPPRFLVVNPVPDVTLDLAGEPKAVNDGDEVVRNLLKLQPKAAAALERLTTDRVGKQVTIVLGGDVVTMHKVREAIKGGDVQITSCAAGAVKYLLEQLKANQKEK